MDAEAQARGVVRVIEAVLQAGADETRYVRAGEGDTVLLLTALTGVELARSPTFLRLAERRRVIGAAPPPLALGGGAAGDAWLCNLIDGLGLDRPELIGDRSVAPLLLGFARSHPDRIAGVAVLGDLTAV